MHTHWYYKTNKRYLTYLKSKQWLARRQRVMFWTVGPLVLVLLAAPWAAGYLL